MLFIILLLFRALGGAADARERSPVEITLTFDDFPMGSSLLLGKQERAKMIVDKLAELQLEAVFFCIGEQVDCDDGQACVALANHNNLLANHSFYHTHLSKLPLDAFKEDFLKTEALLCTYPNYKKWYRFPYLDYGDRANLGGTDRKRVAAFVFLRHAGYQHGYITISTMDWYVNDQLKKAVKEGRKIYWDHLRTAYLSLMDEWLEASHKRWSSIFKMKFVHVLLLHENDLNAIFLSDIVALIKDKEWVIVSPTRAFDSPIPYLSRFVNTKGTLFRHHPNPPIDPLSTEHIKDVLLANHAFE